MKKKLLVLLMALLLTCSLVFAAVACTGSAPSSGTTDNNDDDVTEEEDGVLVSDVKTAIFGAQANSTYEIPATGLYAVIDNLFGATDGVYMEATLYVQVNGEEVALDLAVNVDPDKGSNNAAFVGLSKGGVYLAQIVMDSEVIYFGDGLTQEDTEWFKIDQIEDLGIASEYFTLVTDLVTTLNDANGFLLNKDGSLQSELTNLVGLVDTLVMGLLVSSDSGTYTYPTGFDIEDDSTYTGDYSMTVDLSSISSLLGVVQNSFGLDITGLLESDALAAYSGIIDMVVGVLLGDGNTLDDLIAGTLDPAVTPTIQIIASVDDNLNASGLGVYYKQQDTDEADGLQVAFGIKNLYIGAANSEPTNSIFPDDYSKADDIALELSLEVEVPSILDESLKITGYIVPEFSLSFDDYKVTSVDEETGAESTREVSYLNVDLTGLYGFAYAEYDGKEIDLNVNFEELDNGMYRLSCDLSGLFSIFGYTDATNSKFYYDFDLQGAVDGLIEDAIPEGAVAINNSDETGTVTETSKWEEFYNGLDSDSDNAIDSIYKMIAGFVYSDEGFSLGSLDLGGIVDTLFSVMDTITTLTADESLFIPDEDEDASGMTLNISGILEALLKTDLIDDSELLGDKGPIFGDYDGVASYLDSANIITNLAELFDMEVATLVSNICAVLDLDAGKYDAEDLGEYLMDDLELAISASRGPVDLSADLTIDGDTVIKITASVDLVSADDVEDIKDDLDFGGDDADSDYDGYVVIYTEAVLDEYGNVTEEATYAMSDEMSDFWTWFVEEYVGIV